MQHLPIMLPSSSGRKNCWLLLASPLHSCLFQTAWIRLFYLSAVYSTEYCTTIYCTMYTTIIVYYARVHLRSVQTTSRVQHISHVRARHIRIQKLLNVSFFSRNCEAFWLVTWFSILTAAQSAHQQLQLDRAERSGTKRRHIRIQYNIPVNVRSDWRHIKARRLLALWLRLCSSENVQKL